MNRFILQMLTATLLSGYATSAYAATAIPCTSPNSFTKPTAGLNPTYNQSGCGNAITTNIPSAQAVNLNIAQSGTDNKAHVTAVLGSTVTPVTGANLQIVQSGESNSAKINFAGAIPTTDNVYIKQAGIKNNTSVAIANTNNSVTINRYGQNNTDNLTVNGARNVFTLADNNAPLLPDSSNGLSVSVGGSNNGHYFVQKGNGNKSILKIQGNNNGTYAGSYPTASMAFGNNNTQDISILGDYNSASSTFDGNNNTSNETIVGGGNYAYVFGQGSYHSATINQTGNANRAETRVNGKQNTSTITARGNNNSMTVTQGDIYSHGNVITQLAAVGNNNIMDATQYGSQNTLYALVAGPLGTSTNGDGNIVRTYQNGTGNVMNVAFYGSNNSGTFTQGLDAPVDNKKLSFSYIGNGKNITIAQ